MIEVSNLTKTFRLSAGSDELTVLKDLSFRVEPASMTALTGSSGSGKTTLLSLLAGLEMPTRGSIRLNGVLLNTLSEEARADFRAQHLGFIFQSFRLLPTLTALENVLLPLEIVGRWDGRLSRAEEILERVGLKERRHHLPSQLSGGEQQRVAIARAFVAQPKILFADEPTGNLDSKNGARILELLKELQRERATTLVIVTHDRQVASFADRELRLKDGELER